MLEKDRILRLKGVWRQNESGSSILDCGHYEGMGNATISIARSSGYWTVWSQGIINDFVPLGIPAEATEKMAKAAAVTKVLSVARVKAAACNDVVRLLENIIEKGN